MITDKGASEDPGDASDDNDGDQPLNQRVPVALAAVQQVEENGRRQQLEQWHGRG